MPISNSDITIQYGNFVSEKMQEGWAGYYLNFMFKQLIGSPDAIVVQMQSAIYSFYDTLCKQMYQHPGRKSHQQLLPIGLIAMDLPVFSYGKKYPLREVTTNGGFHVNGPLLMPPCGRVKESLGDHILRNQALYYRNGLERIHVKQIFDADGLADYAFKTVERHGYDKDWMVVLPRGWGEVHADTRFAANAGSLESQAIKSIQAAHNVSEEAARMMLKIAGKKSR